MNQIREISVSDVPDEAHVPCLRAAKATLEQVNRDPVMRARFLIRYSQYCRNLSETGVLPPDWPLPRRAQMWREIEIARGEQRRSLTASAGRWPIAPPSASRAS